MNLSRSNFKPFAEVDILAIHEEAFVQTADLHWERLDRAHTHRHNGSTAAAGDLIREVEDGLVPYYMPRDLPMLDTPAEEIAEDVAPDETETEEEVEEPLE